MSQYTNAILVAIKDLLGANVVHPNIELQLEGRINNILDKPQSPPVSTQGKDSVSYNSGKSH